MAAIASCHMLTFLWLASKQGFQVDRYDDEAVGMMTKNDSGVPWVSRVSLRPRILWGGEKRPTADDIEHLHHAAHEQCFIANSVKTEIVVDANVDSFTDDLLATNPEFRAKIEESKASPRKPFGG